MTKSGSPRGKSTREPHAPHRRDSHYQPSIAQAIAQGLGPPLLATSAIASSSNEPYRDAGEILEAFARYVDVVVDAEQTSAEPSTVLEIDGESVRLVRQGQGTIDDILTMVES